MTYAKSQKIIVKVPGKIMLAGEYAVIAGFPSLSFAINRYMTIAVGFSKDQDYHAESVLWKKPLRLSFYQLQEEPKNLVHEILCCARKNFQIPPVQITIASNLDAAAGVGSSSALCLGMLSGLYALTNGITSQDMSKREKQAIAKLAYEIQLKRQRHASGYDVLTQFTGGVIKFLPDYDSWPGQVELVSIDNTIFHKWFHFFVGKKGAPTTKILQSTKDWLEDSGRSSEFYQLSNKLVGLLVEMQSMDKTSFDEMHHVFGTMGKHRRFFYQSPNFPSYIADRLDNLTGVDKTWSYKTTGAGGEDAIILFGDKEQIKDARKELQALQWNPYEIAICSQGMNFTKSQGEG